MAKQKHCPAETEEWKLRLSFFVYKLHICADLGREVVNRHSRKLQLSVLKSNILTEKCSESAMDWHTGCSDSDRSYLSGSDKMSYTTAKVNVF